MHLKRIHWIIPVIFLLGIGCWTKGIITAEDSARFGWISFLLWSGLGIALFVFQDLLGGKIANSNLGTLKQVMLLVVSCVGFLLISLWLLDYCQHGDSQISQRIATVGFAFYDLLAAFYLWGMVCFVSLGIFIHARNRAATIAAALASSVGFSLFLLSFAGLCSGLRWD